MIKPRLVAISVLFGVLFLANMAYAQTETATVSGRVTDKSGAVVSGAEIQLLSMERGDITESATQDSGIYVFSGVQPGQYRISVRKEGFRRVDLLNLVVNVQDHLEQNFSLQVGSVLESVTVSGVTPLVNTEDASVSSVVDRNFAENLPLNGRSFQSLIYLTPGVIAVAAGLGDSGQFSVNGQRAASNYWTVDGVSANAGVGPGQSGDQATGTVGLSSVLGTTNSLVSVDAMQEFRIQTSTFAPEFGRTPGAQISIVTRSGTNGFHGSAFDYLRNDLFDANNWFNGYTNQPPLPKAKERQNNFGGTFGGPILKSKTFFFFSYEGFRLRLPATLLTTVPDASARQNAAPALQPFLNAFPFDPSQPDLGNGIAQFNASTSNPGSLDAYSIRIDHRLTDKVTIFGRYNTSPSTISQRGFSLDPLSDQFTTHSSAHQLTLGSTWTWSPFLINEFRFNYSRADSQASERLDNFGGAVPLSSGPFPSPYNFTNAQGSFFIVPLLHGLLADGSFGNGLQRQINVVDGVTKTVGSHNLKFGVDYRRLTPDVIGQQYTQFAEFLNMAAAQSGSAAFALVVQSRQANLLFRNLSFYGQDTWHVVPRLTITYGLRWDADFAPKSTSGPSFPAVSGVGNLNDLSQVAVAAPGTPAFRNTWTNFAPRMGVAYQLRDKQGWGTVLRGGFGSFYDLATSETANLVAQGGYPYTHASDFFGTTFPLPPVQAAPPAITIPSVSSPGTIVGFDPNFKLPYALEWNVAIEQGIGAQQSFSATYVGSSGRRLIQSIGVIASNPSASFFVLTSNTADSDYNGLQLQLKRRLARDLQLLASYSWSHSIDSGSSGSVQSSSNSPSSAANTGNRGASDFDVRHAFSTGLTYAIPNLRWNSVAKAVTGGWSLQSIIQAQSARPVPILNGNFANLASGYSIDLRPDVVPGVPFYLYGSQYPGGKAINNNVVSGGCPDGSDQVGPFCTPPLDANGVPTREGNLPRNVVRGFGLFQWDLGVHREFPIGEFITIQFRAEMFNILNHPNFAPPSGDIGNPSTFGLSTQMLGQYLSGGSANTGGLSSLYQSGSPRSMQFALKLSF